MHLLGSEKAEMVCPVGHPQRSLKSPCLGVWIYQRAIWVYKHSQRSVDLFSMGDKKRSLCRLATQLRVSYGRGTILPAKLGSLRCLYCSQPPLPLNSEELNSLLDLPGTSSSAACPGSLCLKNDWPFQPNISVLLTDHWHLASYIPS